jgi:hypothetical protein
MCTVEGVHSPSFRWNGWAVPSFPLASVQKICEWVSSYDDVDDVDFGGEVPAVIDGRVFWVSEGVAKEVLPRRYAIDGEMTEEDFYDLPDGWIWLEVGAE